LAEKLDLRQIDVTKQRDTVNALVEEADIVVDLVAFANPSIYVTDPIGTVQLNLFENLRIVDLCLEHNKFLIQFSSSEVYGINNGREIAFNEDISKLVLGPIKEHRWIYSCAKQMLERIVHAYGLKEGLDYVIIRPFNFVGPRIDYLIHSREVGNPRVFSHFMSALLLDKPLPLVNGGTNQRSYTFIDDAIAGILLILKNLSMFNREIVNIGHPDNETSIKELAYLMIQLYNEETGLHFDNGTESIDGNVFYGDGYADCDRRIPDVTKLTRAGWQPRYNLEETFRKTIQYYLQRPELVTDS
jgi:UDP-apiose/xylose synthase